MQTVFIEAQQPEDAPVKNWGKFMVARFDSEEWSRPSVVSDQYGLQQPLLRATGWGSRHVLVVDLQTGEGAIFFPGGYAAYDLEKHKVWVCPMFEPFLAWLYKQDLSDLTKLPNFVEISAEFSFSGYRRSGNAHNAVQNEPVNPAKSIPK